MSAAAAHDLNYTLLRRAAAHCGATGSYQTGTSGMGTAVTTGKGVFMHITRHFKDDSCTKGKVCVGAGRSQNQTVTSRHSRRTRLLHRNDQTLISSRYVRARVGRTHATSTDRQKQCCSLTFERAHPSLTSLIVHLVVSIHNPLQRWVARPEVP